MGSSFEHCPVLRVRDLRYPCDCRRATTSESFSPIEMNKIRSIRHNEFRGEASRPTDRQITSFITVFTRQRYEGPTSLYATECLLHMYICFSAGLAIKCFNHWNCSAKFDGCNLRPILTFSPKEQPSQIRFWRHASKTTVLSRKYSPFHNHSNLLNWSTFVEAIRLRIPLHRRFLCRTFTWIS